ncbi:hypothetical protein AtubIFM55763_011193 [Aspergillus tubingensis]|uniref:Uncharacterized protein n=1 Tax=Aspergillus tubingensis TaxID=5068 RepID=A0A9W6EMG4_ASPTU|nr:hypothetical protein AtubIFM55763_011193 [Aspergillus tubingensis]GLA85258.1 hypothetical protein AtubIFM56815_009489 [Aspergillus tubingensis]GLB00950.1 hypothetical protein AtubIFM57143_010318 [Aspergillus tubingensis]
MSSKCYTTNTSSTIMAMVMIRGTSKIEPSAHRSSLKKYPGSKGTVLGLAGILHR